MKERDIFRYTSKFLCNYNYFFSQAQQVYILHIHLLAMVHMTWGTWMCARG